MSYKTETIYAVVCDRCGKQYEGYEYSYFGSPGDADESAYDSDWDSEKGNHLCDSCIPHGPDWDDEHESAYEGKTLLVCQWCNP